MSALELLQSSRTLRTPHSICLARKSPVLFQALADVTSETIKLDYARKEALLAPIDEIGRIWRYGTEASGIKLDGLDGEGWAKRRAQVEEQLAQTARALVEMARVKEMAKAPELRRRRATTIGSSPGSRSQRQRTRPRQSRRRCVI